MSESKQQLYIHSSENVNWVTTEFQGFKQENWIRASLRISEAFQGKKKKIILGPFKRISFPNCMDLTWINPIPGSFVSAPHWCDRWTGWSEGFSVGQVVLQSELKRASPPPPFSFSVVPLHPSGAPGLTLVLSLNLLEEHPPYSSSASSSTNPFSSLLLKELISGPFHIAGILIVHCQTGDFFFFNLAWEVSYISWGEYSTHTLLKCKSTHTCQYMQKHTRPYVQCKWMSTRDRGKQAQSFTKAQREREKEWHGKPLMRWSMAALW